jgi:hypothetical protein
MPTPPLDDDENSFQWVSSGYSTYDDTPLILWNMVDKMFEYT